MAAAVPDSSRPQPPPSVEHPTVPGPIPTADPSALSVEISAPRTCVIGEEPTFQVLVTNKGDQELTEVNVSCRLDPELYVLQATRGHQRRESDGAILFKLPPIPPGEVGLLSEVLCRCVSEAERACFFVEVTCREGIRKNSEACVAIRPGTAPSPSSLKMTVAALRNPIDLGRDLTCEIRVTNNSSVTDRNVVVNVVVPEQMVIDRLRTRGPVPFSIDQQTIRFDPVDTLPPNETLEYRIRLRTRAAGDAVLRAAVTSYNVPTAQVEEDHTTINDTE